MSFIQDHSLDNPYNPPTTALTTFTAATTTASATTTNTTIVQSASVSSSASPQSTEKVGLNREIGKVDKAYIYLYPSVLAYESLYQFCKKHVDFTTITPPTTTSTTTAAVQHRSESVYTTYAPASEDAHVDDEIVPEVAVETAAESEEEEGHSVYEKGKEVEVADEGGEEAVEGGYDSDEELDRMNEIYGKVGLGQHTGDRTGTYAPYSSYDPLYISKSALSPHAATPTSSSEPSSTAASATTATTTAVKSAFDRGISLPPSYPKPTPGLKPSSGKGKSANSSTEKKNNKTKSTPDASSTTTTVTTIVSSRYKDSTSNIPLVLVVKKEDLIKAIISKLTTYNAILAPDGT